MRKFVIACLLSVLTACSSGGSGTVVIGQDPFVAALNGFLAKISQFTVADLTWAHNDAVAKNDVVAEPCWAYLLTQVQNQGKGNGLPPLGLASFIQTQRDLLTFGSGIPPKFQAACGALILDEQVRIAKFGIGAAGALATGGVAAPGLGVTAGIASGAVGASVGAMSHLP